MKSIKLMHWSGNTLHFGKSTHSIRIHTAQAKRSELLGLYWVIAFIVVSLYRFTLLAFCLIQPFGIHASSTFITAATVHFIPYIAFTLFSTLHFVQSKLLHSFKHKLKPFSETTSSSTSIKFISLHCIHFISVNSLFIITVSIVKTSLVFNTSQEDTLLQDKIKQ